MVESGNYDEAFSYAVSKLRGEKNKKTEYVKALEKAFDKLQSRDENTIVDLNAANNPDRWDRVYNVLSDMQNRQNALEPLLPLISKEGYKAGFSLDNYSSRLAIAENNICAFHYNEAVNLIAKSKSNKDKTLARTAYDELDVVARYKNNYKNSASLREEAIRLGRVVVFYDLITDNVIIPVALKNEILNMPISQYDNLWVDHVMGGQDISTSADFVVAIELLQILTGSEMESANHYQESKDVLIETKTVKEKRDSVDVIVEKQIFEKRTAYITEVFRSKESVMQGKLRLFDNKTKEFLTEIPISVYNNFKGYGCNYTGDYKAMTPETCDKLDHNLELFPSDNDVALVMTRAFRSTIVNEAKSFNSRFR